MASEDYGSSDSASGDPENDNGSSSHKSPAPGEKSPGQSSSSSSTHADDEGGSPCSTQVEESVGVDQTTSSSTPEHFERMSTDRESTCARTDLVYVHPPAPVKQMEASTTKVRLLYKIVCFFVISSATYMKKRKGNGCARGLSLFFFVHFS